MADHVPINPCTIPQFTGDLDALEQDRTAIAAAASTLRDTGANVDNTFQGLASFYSAPEAAQLFATTNRVQTESDYFADQLETAAQALGEFAVEARPIVARLKQLQAQATAFTSKINGDAHWKDDGKKVDENNDLIHDVNAAAEAFWAAERTCASKIRALYGLPPLTVDDGTHADGMYGYRAADLNKVQDLPWGSQLQQSHRWYDIGHWTKSFLWDGLIMDGVVGTVRGLGTLVGADGSAAAGQAWTGLAKLATGIALTTNPGTAFVFWNTDAKAMPAWFRDSRTTMKETGKALVAWDQWNKNPARAAGAVTFNVLTTVFSGGVGTGAKTGGLAKTLSVAGKAGRLIDPMTYVGQAAGKAASLTFTKLKIGELLANIGKVDGAFPKVDDVVWNDLPKTDTPGAFPHPNETARLPDDALGRPQYLDKVTNQLLGHNGLPKQNLTAIPKGTDHPLAEVPTRQEATVGARARTPGGTADNMPHNSHTEPGGGGAGGHGNTDTTTIGGSHTDAPSTGGHGDGPTVPHQSEGLGGGGGGGGGDAPGGGHNGPNPENQPVRLETDTISQQPSGTMPPESEAAVLESLAKAKVQPHDQARMITQLKKSEYGAAIADYVASGRFSDAPGYRKLLSQIKQAGMTPAVHQALQHAAELQEKGIGHIEFELSLTERKLDLDVATRVDGRIEYGAQLKDVKRAKGIRSAIDGIADHQLVGDGVDVKVAILDIHDTKGALTERDLRAAQGAADRTNASFELRFNDGSITVYPTNATKP
ncbi:hypothetical protein [Streptomyces sp. NPDC047976]|uniref:hypothetical protein n=1 Tax=Streptomyces sp. NPDC047976 TaxID=3155746 RepID=UPI00343E9A86